MRQTTYGNQSWVYSPFYSLAYIVTSSYLQWSWSPVTGEFLFMSGSSLNCLAVWWSPYLNFHKRSSCALLHVIRAETDFHHWLWTIYRRVGESFRQVSSDVSPGTFLEKVISNPVVLVHDDYYCSDWPRYPCIIFEMGDTFIRRRRWEMQGGTPGFTTISRSVEWMETPACGNLIWSPFYEHRQKGLCESLDSFIKCVWIKDMFKSSFV